MSTVVFYFTASSLGRDLFLMTSLVGPYGIENHLMYLAIYESDLHVVYKRQAEWNRQFAMNCLDLGVDMIHVSDDWGGQTGLMFSPATWRNLIYPYHKITCDAVRQRKGYLSLHSDGNVTQVLDGIVDLGYHVLHPYQVSAGMDYALYFERYKNRFTIMGGGLMFRPPSDLGIWIDSRPLSRMLLKPSVNAVCSSAPVILCRTTVRLRN